MAERFLGFETIGNATLIAYDGGPVLATDPWLGGEAYFGSWGLPYDIPADQLDAILTSEFIWLSHGHPDHINAGALEKLHGRKILLPDHVGGRIHDDLKAAGFDVEILKDREWVKLSDKISVCCVSDYFQDAVLLVNINGRLVVNLNDASDRAWGSFVKRIASNFEKVYLLKLFGFGDVDMMNFFDEQGNRVIPPSVRKRPIGEQVSFYTKLYGATDVIPFSSFHRYQREDSIWANELVTPEKALLEGFDHEAATLHPAFQRVCCETDTLTGLSPAEKPVQVFSPSAFGDDWSEPLEPQDILRVQEYFRSIEALSDSLDFITMKVGGQEATVPLAGRGFQRGITFECPRASLITAINHEVFDDLLIGNFMKTTLHGAWENVTLHPDFTPFVAKFADNGRAKSKAELEQYFDIYRRRAPFAFLKHRFEKESERRIRKFVKLDSPGFRLLKKTYLFLNKA